MSETTNTTQAKEQIRSARADIDRDFAELDHQLHFDMVERIRDNAPLIVAGSAAVGAIIGYGGMKGVKALLALGVSVVAAAVVMQRMRGDSSEIGSAGVPMR